MTNNWGKTGNNEYGAIDTFFNTKTLTQAHFKDLIKTGQTSRINFKLPKHSDQKVWDSIKITSCRVIVVDTSAKVLLRDSFSNHILTDQLVYELATAPILTRILVDKIQGVRYYGNELKDSFRVNLVPMFYELKE